MAFNAEPYTIIFGDKFEEQLEALAKTLEVDKNEFEPMLRIVQEYLERDPHSFTINRPLAYKGAVPTTSPVPEKQLLWAFRINEEDHTVLMLGVVER